MMTLATRDMSKTLLAFSENSENKYTVHGINLHADVTGDGSATISGTATLAFGAASTANTTFADGGDGTLKLDDSSSFTGTVSGFNEGDSLDLGDVAFGHGTGTTLRYAANEAGTGYRSEEHTSELQSRL